MSVTVIRAFRVALIMLATTCFSPSVANDSHVELFAQQPIMTRAQLSPDGTRVAFMSSLQGRFHLVIEQFTPEFSRAILSPGDELHFDWVHWVNNERLVLSASYIAMRCQENVVERAQPRILTARTQCHPTTATRLFSVDALAKDLTPIIKPGRRKDIGSRVATELPPPQIQDNIVDWLVNEPNHILVAVDADFDNFDEVRRVDVRNGKYKNVLSNFAGNRTWTTDQAGELRAGWGYNNDDLTVTFKNQDGRWTDSASLHWVLDGFVPVAITADPDIALVQGPSDSGLSMIRRLNLKTGEYLDTVFEHEKFDADYVIVDSISGVSVGVSYTEHLPQQQYFDAEMVKLQASINKALPDATNSIVNTSIGRRQVLIFSYTDTNPGAYFVWDRDNKSLIHYSDHIANLGEDVLSPVTPVQYRARDGLVIPAYLTIPHGLDASDLPTVVLPHGGPRERDDKRYWFISQFLASQGYVVLQPNFRGSSGYGASFADAGHSEWGGKMQDDVTDGTKWLIDEGIADPERMCILGWSYGGYAAAMAAVKTPEVFRCAISINGVLNLPLQILDDDKYFGGSEWTDHWGLGAKKSEVVSPYHQADKINIPMLIVQIEDDSRVHIEQGRAMAKQLKKLGKDVEYVEVEFGVHSLRNVAGRGQVLKAVDAFLAENIGQ